MGDVVNYGGDRKRSAQLVATTAANREFISLGVVALIVIPQACGTYWTDRARTKLLDGFQSERKSPVIAMIHRQETVSVLGVPVINFIDIEASEESNAHRANVA